MSWTIARHTFALTDTLDMIPVPEDTAIRIIVDHEWHLIEKAWRYRLHHALLCTAVTVSHAGVPVFLWRHEVIGLSRANGPHYELMTDWTTYMEFARTLSTLAGHARPAWLGDLARWLRPNPEAIWPWAHVVQARHRGLTVAEFEQQVLVPKMQNAPGHFFDLQRGGVVIERGTLDEMRTADLFREEDDPTLYAVCYPSAARARVA